MQTDPENPSCFRRFLNRIFGLPAIVETIAAVAPVLYEEVPPANDTPTLTV